MICFECQNEAHQSHHIIPRSLGGKATIPLCQQCHDKVHGYTRTNGNYLTRFGKARKNFDLYAEIFYSVVIDKKSFLDIVYDSKRSIECVKRIVENFYLFDWNDLFTVLNMSFQLSSHGFYTEKFFQKKWQKIRTYFPTVNHFISASYVRNK